MASVAPAAALDTAKLTLAGHVQGVGFRPFVYRMAKANGITGEVCNKLGEVDILATGTPAALRQFRQDLICRAPPLSKPVIVADETLDLVRFDEFSIAPSADNAEASIFVPPDYFMCDECRTELADPDDRRYRYPFINCTQCGPRYTLIERMPYDRPNTSMSAFPLCAACREEYEDPADRRFHAEPVACPDCGPRIEWSASNRAQGLEGERALQSAIEDLRSGRVVAVKGVGGYHLMCDARDPDAVQRLRKQKGRPDKPLAVMFPLTGADGLDAVRTAVDLSAAEWEQLTSPARPIVLAGKSDGYPLAENVAPGLAELGVFLPYTPLHQLLLERFGGPLVATSGNISGEPVLTDNAEAAARLKPIADAFLHHDRPIVRPADDPVYRSIRDRARPIRAGRGTAPLEIDLPWSLASPVLAVGAHMKGTVALGWDNRVVVSPHIGEMDSPRSLAVFEKVVGDLQALYQVRAERVICDAHPGYATNRWAHRESGLPVSEVWHHEAHASALVAEQGGGDHWLVFAWDGVGLGRDGTLWGGEALAGRPGEWRRAASMRPFRLPGGERAGREPWRSAAAICWEAGLEPALQVDGIRLARSAWDRKVNAPVTTAVGRLFDAAAALVSGTAAVSYEAQGPMELESICRQQGAVVECEVTAGDDGVLRTDWSPLIPMLMNRELSASARAESFHSSMAAIVADQAAIIARGTRVERVGLTGGVFQNRVLTEQAAERLERRGFDVVLCEALPANDASISYGQVAEFCASGRRGGD